MELERPPERLKCDFCDSLDVRWAYPSSDFRHELSVKGVPETVDWGSHGGWAACDACHRLIQANERASLVRRCAKKFARQEGAPYKFIYRQLLPLHAKFWSSRTGDPMPTDPTNVFDPTRDDPFGEMSRMEGQAFAIEAVQESTNRETTFSEKVLDETFTAIHGWIATRIRRRWHATGVGPKKARIELRVILDDEGEDNNGPVQFVLPDVRHALANGDHEAVVRAFNLGEITEMPDIIAGEN